MVFKPLLADVLADARSSRSDAASKAIKMIYATGGDGPTKNVPTSRAERAAFVLSDAEILTLGRWACTIEDHYGCPMDMEWAKDGETGEMFIVQARPETVQSRRATGEFRTLRDQRQGTERWRPASPSATP